MLEYRHNSQDQDVESSSSDDTAELEKLVQSTFDISKVGGSGDVPFGDDPFPPTLVTAVSNDISYNTLPGEEVYNVVQMKVDTLSSKVVQKSEDIPKIHNSLSEVSDSPSDSGTVRESISWTSHPISQALMSDKEDFCKMRLLNGKPPNDEHALLSKDIALERRVRSDDEPVQNEQMGTLSRIKAEYVKRSSRKSLDLGSSDEVKSAFESSTQQTQRKSTMVEHNRIRSSTLPISSFIISRIIRRNTQSMGGRLPAKSTTEPLKCDSFSNLGVVLKDAANFEEPTHQVAEAYEMLSTLIDERKETCSKKPKWVTPSTMSITPGARSELKKKKTSMSMSRKFHPIRVSQTSFSPECENRDPYSEKITEISEKLEKFLRAEPWPVSSVANSRLRYHSGEHSVTRSVSTVAQRDDSTSDIFNSVLVDEISKKHSYLKPHQNSTRSKKRRAYSSPLWHEQDFANPFESEDNRPVTRYIRPFNKSNKRDTIRVPQMESKEDKGWFYPIFSIVSPYI